MATKKKLPLGPTNLPRETKASFIISTLKTSLNTVGDENTSKDNNNNNSWVTYTFIVGIAAAVLVICTVIAIVASRYKSLRKARAQYAKDQMRARQEIEKQRRGSRSQTLSTTVSIADPFYIFPFSNASIDDASEDVFYLPTTASEKRNSFVQAIPSFSQPLNVAVPIHASRNLDLTPPPRLSPSFQGSDERFEVRRIPARRYSDSARLPRSPFRAQVTGQPDLPPREPILPPRRTRRHSHQIPRRKQPLLRQKSHSTLELNIKANYGFIPEEIEPCETLPKDILPSPDYN